MVAKVLGVSPSSGYELLHEPGFLMLRIGSRMVVPQEQFRPVGERTHGGRRVKYSGGNFSRYAMKYSSWVRVPASWRSADF